MKPTSNGPRSLWVVPSANLATALTSLGVPAVSLEAVFAPRFALPAGVDRAAYLGSAAMPFEEIEQVARSIARICGLPTALYTTDAKTDGDALVAMLATDFTQRTQRAKASEEGGGPQ